MKRCDRANGSDVLQSYHDHEWEVEVHDDRTLFEFPVLEGARAEVSRSAILRKRGACRITFDHFDTW